MQTKILQPGCNHLRRNFESDFDVTVKNINPHSRASAEEDFKRKKERMRDLPKDRDILSPSLQETKALELEGKK